MDDLRILTEPGSAKCRKRERETDPVPGNKQKPEILTRRDGSVLQVIQTHSPYD
jgi:hypothetical protein